MNSMWKTALKEWALYLPYDLLQEGNYPPDGCIMKPGTERTLEIDRLSFM